MSNSTTSSQATQSAKTQTSPVQSSEAQDLKALDQAAGRLDKAQLPSEPYLVTVNGSLIPSAAVGYRWIESTPFSPEEAYLQYQSFLFRPHSESLLRFSPASELAKMQAQTQNPNPTQHTDPAQNTAAASTSATTPATTSTTAPTNTSSNTPPAPKIKMSLADYRNRKLAEAAGLPPPKLEPPRHQQPDKKLPEATRQASPRPDATRHQQPDLRKQTLKKELEASAKLRPTIVENNLISAPTTAGTKRPAAELETYEAHPESPQTKKQRSGSYQDEHMTEAGFHRSAPTEPAIPPSRASPKRSAAELSEDDAKDSTTESSPAKKQRLDSHSNIKPAASSGTHTIPTVPAKQASVKPSASSSASSSPYFPFPLFGHPKPTMQPTTSAAKLAAAAAAASTKSTARNTAVAQKDRVNTAARAFGGSQPPKAQENKPTPAKANTTTSKEKGLLAWLPRAPAPPKGDFWVPQSGARLAPKISPGLERELLSERAVGRWLPGTTAGEDSPSHLRLLP